MKCIRRERERERSNEPEGVKEEKREAWRTEEQDRN